MNKAAIKTFAIWARNKLMADIGYKAGLLGITDKEIKQPLPQSSQTVQFFDIGTKEPNSIMGIEVEQRKKLVEEIQRKEKQSDYATAYQSVIEEVAYTWFNRLIAIRFMEVNDYLPTGVRVLSSEASNKAEPDLVTYAMEVELDYSPYETDRIIQLKLENKLDELFRLLFIKQCNALNENLPELFEKTNDYTELLLNISFTDNEGIIYHLVHDISEDDFNVSKDGQIEIIGWLYQYYNTEPKETVDKYVKKGIKVAKEDIPAKTQLFTPHWIVKYMVENSLGRLWLEGHPNEDLKSNWKYYLEEAEQEDEVQKQLEIIREEYKLIKPEDIKIIDPAMGSGHILVYAFDVLMEIYESSGFSQRDAAISILENNLYGLDIDQRAYQLAYFSMMMKARQFNRGILNGDVSCHVYAIEESNDINKDQLSHFGVGMDKMEKDGARLQLEGLLDTFIDGKEYGSILNVENYNSELLHHFINQSDGMGQMSVDTLGIEKIKESIHRLVDIGQVMAQQYDVVVTNPPYLGSKGMNKKLSEYVMKNYPDNKSDLFACFIEKGNNSIKRNRFNAMVTMQSWMFLSSFKVMREKILTRKTITNLMHMDNMVMGIAFGTSVTIIKKTLSNKYKGTYNQIKFVDIKDDKPITFPVIKNRFNQIDAASFSKIPGSPIAYLANEKIFSLYKTTDTLADISIVRKGLATGNVDLFIKYWYEVNSLKIAFNKENKKWYPCHKGGEFRKWYGNFEKVINWEDDGKQIKNYTDENGKLRSRPQNLNVMFKKGIVFSKITSGGASCRIMTGNELFDDAVQGIFPLDEKSTLNLMGILNSKIVEVFLQFINPTLNKQIYDLERIAVVESSDIASEIVELLISISKRDWDDSEISWDFTGSFITKQKTNLIIKAYELWRDDKEITFVKAKALEENLNRILINEYGLKESITPFLEDSQISLKKADLRRDIRSFVSYAVGCMFGRYSLDVDGLVYAGGDWDDSKYTTFIPDKDNILPITDEEYFKDDIVGLFTAFVKKVYGEETLEENLNFIANALGNNGNSSREVIRTYFMKDFFKDHTKIYKKRPIYWLFDSGKQDGFKALINMHRYDENSIGNIRIDYLHRMQKIYENEIARMQDTIENNDNAREATAAAKRKEKLIKQLQETKQYDEEIAHLALARIPMDLDDGVKVNYEKVQTDLEGKVHNVLAKI